MLGLDVQQSGDMKNKSQLQSSYPLIEHSCDALSFQNYWKDGVRCQCQHLIHCLPSFQVPSCFEALCGPSVHWKWSHNDSHWYTQAKHTQTNQYQRRHRCESKPETWFDSQTARLCEVQENIDHTSSSREWMEGAQILIGGQSFSSGPILAYIRVFSLFL